MENEQALKLMAEQLRFLDSVTWEDRQLALAKGYRATLDLFFAALSWYHHREFFK